MLRSVDFFCVDKKRVPAILYQYTILIIIIVAERGDFVFCTLLVRVSFWHGWVRLLLLYSPTCLCYFERALYYIPSSDCSIVITVIDELCFWKLLLVLQITAFFSRILDLLLLG